MKTKFISTNGFGEIENLPTSKERENQIRARELKRKFRGENILLTLSYYLAIKPAKAIKNFSFEEYKRTLTFRKAMTGLVAPVAGVIVLLLTIGFWTQYVDFGLSVENNGQTIASISDSAVLEQAQEITNDMLSDDVDPDFKPEYKVTMMNSGDSASELSSALVSTSSSLSENVSGLYINDRLIGVCNSDSELQDALDELLKDDIEHYDDKSEVGFENKVEVKSGIYSNKSISSAEELVKKAKDNNLLKILVKTDIVMTEKQPFDTKVKYDKTKDSSYKKITKKGQTGTQKTTYRVSYIDGVQVDAVITDVKTIKKAVNQIEVRGKGAEGSEDYGVSSSGYVWPVPSVHDISSPYGYREGGEFHTGLDIANGDCYGAPIVASRAGTVIWAGYDDSGYGNYVILDHGDGIKTLYGHCSSVCVSQGQQVSQGQTISYIGSTGQSSGNHLHFEVRTGDERSDRQNPQDYL